MKELFAMIYLKIPSGYQKAFDIEILRDNYRRLRFISIVLFIIELILYTFEEMLLGTGYIILGFLVGNFVMIPIIWFMNKNIENIHIYMLKAVQYIFALFVLAFGIALTFAAQHSTDLVHMYFMMVFGVSFILYLKSFENLIILLLAMAPFLVFLPFFQPDPTIVFVVRVNSVLVNLIAWLLSRIMIFNRVQLFLDRIIIENKNIELADLVLRDSMTRLYNHETSLSLLQEEIALAKGKKPLSIMIADIDDFKTINDTHGHLAGDAVIKTIAKLITEVVRAGDRVCRYGGEEFMIIMPDTDLKSAFHCAERIRAALKNQDYGIEIHPTLSGGISQYSGETITEFILKTDGKLYEAKQCGKNQFK